MSIKRLIRSVIVSAILLLSMVVVLVIGLVAHTGILEKYQVALSLIFAYLGSIATLLAILLIVENRDNGTNCP